MSYYINNQTYRQRQPNHRLATSYFEELLNAVALKTNSQPRMYGNGYKLCCPSHEDKNPSFTMREGDYKILVYCFAKCTEKEICSAMGWPPSALFLHKNQRG